MQDEEPAIDETQPADNAKRRALIILAAVVYTAAAIFILSHLFGVGPR